MEIEQGRINVPIGGISRAGSESKTNDGLCNEIINLEAKDMTLVPYEHKSVETNGCKIYGYKTKKIFLHKTSIQTNLVYINSANELRFFNYEKFNKQKKESFSEDDKGCILAEQDGLYYIESTKIGDVDEYENVDLFYNMFSFRDGTWYMFKEGKYINDYRKENMKIDLAFDIKTQGIAIANRYFQNTNLMMIGDPKVNEDGAKRVFNLENSQKVASNMAKNVNGLYNMIDSYIDSCSGKFRINGICYLRYGVRSSDGYAYISDPILIASPDVRKIFKNHCGCQKKEGSSYEIVENTNIPPLVVLGGTGTVIDSNKTQTEVNTPFNTVSLRKGFRRFTHIGLSDTDLSNADFYFGCREGDYDRPYYYGVGESASDTIEDLKFMRDMMRTKGWSFDGYDNVNDSNTSCKLFENVIPVSNNGYDNFNDSKDEEEYISTERKLKYHELSWAVTGSALNSSGSTSSYSPNASMYACKEYGHLFAKCINMSDGFESLLNQGLIIQVDVFITNPVNPVLPVIEEDDETYNDITINEFTKNYVDAAQCNSGRIRKSKSEIEAEMSNLTYFKLFSLKKNDLLELKKFEEAEGWKDINDKITQAPKGLVASEEAQQLTISGNLQNTNYEIGYVYNTQLHTAGGKRNFDNNANNPQTHQRMDKYKSSNDKLYILYELYSNTQKLYFKQEYDCNNGKFANPISLPHNDVSKVVLVRKDSAGSFTCKLFDKSELKTDSNLTYIHYYPQDTSGYEEAIKAVYPDVEFDGFAANNNIQNWLNSHKDTVTIESRKNTMQVMLPEDPLVADRQYTVGTGDIIDICANTVALSAGQYGEYPIFVFTTEGIYTLQLDSQKLEYSNITPLSREICNNPKSICQVDNGVFFSSEKGLMVISGTQVLAVSDVVKGTPKPTGNIVYENAIGNVKLVELRGNVSKIDFVEYLKECQIVYLYKKNKLLITNEKYDYSYLYDLGEKTFTKLSYKYHYSISNYPNDLLVANQGDNSYIYEFPIESVDETIETMIETRAIKLATEDIKSSYRVILKGLFETDGDEDNHLGIYVFGSLDCEKWAYIGGNEVSCKYKTIRNIGCKVERMGAKYLRVLFIGKLKKGSKVDTLEISSTKKYPNKIR